MRDEIAHPDPSAPSMDPIDGPAEDASATGSEHADGLDAGDETPKTGLMCCGFDFGA